MLTEIEQFLFRNNRAHILLGFDMYASELTISISPTTDPNSNTSFIFYQFEKNTEEKVWEESIEIGFPTNIIGFESTKLENDKWKFCLHTDEIEWIFISKWPKRITSVSSGLGY